MDEGLARRNRRLGLLVCAGALLMLGAAYAAVPLYQMFCRVTGFGGTPKRADAIAVQPQAQTVRVRFDANVGSGLPWSFAPEQRVITVHYGQPVQVSYRVRNLSDRPTTGMATFNVTPDVTGAYFNKLQCFCFTEQTLKPGEAMQMPVTLFVDPAMLKDRAARRVPEITLSYTFYRANPSSGATISAIKAVADPRASR